MLNAVLADVPGIELQVLASSYLFLQTLFFLFLKKGEIYLSNHHYETEHILRLSL